MKRSIVTYAGILGATYAGILGLSQCLASQALAAGEERLCYSTGPLENAVGDTDAKVSKNLFIKLLNNSTKNIKSEVFVFSLDGVKRLNFSDEGTVEPQSSVFLVADVSDKFQFELQVEVERAAPNSMLLAAFGKDKEGKLVAAHRVVHSEFTRIPCAGDNNI